MSLFANYPTFATLQKEKNTGFLITFSSVRGMGWVRKNEQKNHKYVDQVLSNIQAHWEL